MDASVIIRVAASQINENVLAGQPYQKPASGHIRRIKGIGFIPYGSDIAEGAGSAFDGTYVMNVKVDNQDAIFDSPPTGYPSREGTEVGSGAISGIFSGSVIPMNTVLVEGQSLNAYMTTPANGESLLVILAEDIPVGV